MLLEGLVSKIFTMEYLKSFHSLLDQVGRSLPQQPDPEFLRHADFRRYPDHYGIPPGAVITAEKTWWKKFLTRLTNLLTLLAIVASILLNIYFLLLKPQLATPQKSHEPTSSQEKFRADSLDREVGYLHIINADLEVTAQERQQRIIALELEIQQLKALNPPAKMVRNGKVIDSSSGQFRKAVAARVTGRRQTTPLPVWKKRRAEPGNTGDGSSMSGNQLPTGYR